MHEFTNFSGNHEHFPKCEKIAKKIGDHEVTIEIGITDPFSNGDRDCDCDLNL